MAFSLFFLASPGPGERLAESCPSPFLNGRTNEAFSEAASSSSSLNRSVLSASQF